MKLRGGKLVKRDFARATSRIRRTILHETRENGGEKRGDNIKTNTPLYQELKVLANYVVYWDVVEGGEHCTLEKGKFLSHRPLNALRRRRRYLSNSQTKAPFAPIK